MTNAILSTHPIFMAIDMLKAARIEEDACTVALADAQAQAERLKAIVLGEAYATGQIDGKNAETRKAQEGDKLAASATVQEAEATVRLARSKHASARIEMDFQRERFQAMLALTRVEAEAV